MRGYINDPAICATIPTPISTSFLLATRSRSTGGSGSADVDIGPGQLPFELGECL